jgi:hypothetical protein
MYEFFIDRKGNLICDGDFVACFGNVDAAADAAIRFSQDNDALYRIFYPL